MRLPSTIMSTALTTLSLTAGVLTIAACGSGDPNTLTDGTVNPGNPCEGTGNSSSEGGGSSTGGAGSGGMGSGGGTQNILDQRELSYTEALRTASFKLVGNAPTLEQSESIRGLSEEDQALRYEELVDEMLDSTEFKRVMVSFWKNTMRQGGDAVGMFPSRDTAPTFAAKLMVEGDDFTRLFTATTGNCPTFDGTDFVDGTCDNGPITAGLLTDNGIHAQYYGNLAFRRYRFIQETFACHKQPSELSDTPIPMGAGSYTAPWPFTSISGTSNGGRIDFLDVESAICANCHATANHVSPLLANFDENGNYTPGFSVFIPIETEPLAEFSDWLPPGETTAWRFGKPAQNLAELGAHMAADPEVQACSIIRVWNYAMSKGDVVNDAASVPTEVIQPLVDEFSGNNFNLRTAIRSTFLHDDFVRF